MTEVECQYKDKCSEYNSFLCNNCLNNAGKRSYYRPKPAPYVPIDPYPYVPWTPPHYPYITWWTDYDTDTKQYTAHIKLKITQ